MTDARLPSRWLADPALEALSDRLWRIHTAALMWSAEQGTDGRMPPRTLRLLHPDGATAADADDLVAAELWRATDDGYEVNDWGRTQSLAADVEATRAANRERQARHRARASAAPPAAPVTRDVTRDVTGQSRRQGEARPMGVSSPSRDGGGSAPPPRTCTRHPNWDHQEPCRACGDDRKAAQSWSPPKAPKRLCDHRYEVSGYCKYCGARDDVPA